MTDQPATRPQEIACEQCRELLSEFLDHELTAQEWASVEHHMATCLKCANESSRLAGLKKIVQHWEGVRGGEGFHEKVMQQYISESRMMSSKPFTEAAAEARASKREPAAEDGAGNMLLWLLLTLAAAGAVVWLFLM